MIQWLYRYIFRGFGLVFWIAVITCLYVAINSMIQPPPAQNPSPTVTSHR